MGEYDVQSRAYTVVLTKVAEVADGFGNLTERFGQTASRNFGGNSARRKAQIRGLENIAYSANKVSDIKNFIKRQTGRHREWQDNNFGSDLLNSISNLQNEAKTIHSSMNQVFGAAPIDSLPSEREIHIFLIREYIKQIASHYLYLNQ